MYYNVNLSVVKNLAKAYMKDICDMLEIDDSSIRLLLVPTTDNGQPSLILENDDTIVLSELYLKSLIGKGFTPLRIRVYQEVRLIYLRRKGVIRSNINEIFKEASVYYYAQVIALLKGLALSLPSSQSFINASVIKKVEDCMRIEFGLTGNMIKLPIQPIDGADLYKMHLSETDTLKYSGRLFSREIKSYAVAPIDKGTIENPFDNINDAVAYIKGMEDEAYEKDKLLRDIANEKYFYDVNQGQFRIHWASPYVSVYKNCYPSRSFLVNQMDTGFFSLKPNLYHKKFLYRGQSNYYPGKPCVPNLFRDPKHNDKRYYLDFLIFSHEMELVIKTHPLVQLLEQGIDILHDDFKIRMNYPGLAQHYYNKSNLLDLTSDVDVMKFFATTGYDRENDEYYPLRDCKDIGVIYCYELRYPEAFQQHKGYALKTIGKQVPMRSGSQSGFLLEMEYGVDFKTLPEVTAIYFKHDNKIAGEIFEQSEKGEFYFGKDFLQHAWKYKLKDRFARRVISRKTVEYNVSLNPKETFDSICRKLSDMGITVDDFDPCLSEEELDMYYQTAVEDWYSFCDDIHFYGPEDELYREELRNLPNRDEYKWAFSRK